MVCCWTKDELKLQDNGQRNHLWIVRVNVGYIWDASDRSYQYLNVFLGKGSI